MAFLLLSALAVPNCCIRRQVEHDLAASRKSLETGQPAAARRHLERAGFLAPMASEPRLALAEIELSLGDYKLAEARMESLAGEDLAIAQRARVSIAAARIDFLRGRQNAAIERSRRALAAARASGRPELEARALLADAMIRMEMGADARSIEAAVELAREKAGECGNDRLRAAAEAEIGFVRWWYLRTIDDPIPDHLAPALEVFRRHGDTLGAADVLHLIGSARLRADDLIAFFEVQDEALKIWERAGNRARQAEAHLQLGWAWDRLENPRRAHRHLEQADRLARESGYELLVPRVQRYLAAVEHRSGRSERAVARLENLLAENGAVGREARSIFGVLGDARRRLGEPSAARAAYVRALELDRPQDLSFRVWILSGLARTALAEADLARARRALSELESRIGPRSDWSDRRRVLLLRSAVLEAEAGTSPALAPLLEAAEIESRSLGSVGALTVDYGLGVLKNLLPRLLNHQPTGSATPGGDKRRLWAAEAFRLLEQARLRPVRRLQLARARPGPSTVVARAREDRALAAAREAATAAAATPSASSVARLRRAYAHYEEEIFRSRSGTGDFVGGRAGSVAEIQQRLPSRTAIVAYVLVRRVAMALVVLRDRFEAIDLAFRPSELGPRIKILRHQLAAREGEGWRPPAGELGRLLLGPVDVSGALDGIDRLLVVPMGELHDVPFAALLDKAGRPWIEKLAVATLSAASILLDERSRPAGIEVVFGREEYRELGLPDLPAARQEARSIARASNARLIFGPRFDETAFRRLAPGASRLHIVAHARIEPEMPMLSRLILAPPEMAGGTVADGELTVRELLALDLQAELVTLSACRSGLALAASRRPNPELRRTGLVEGFLLAGARNVLGTLFPVEDQATAAFMTALERELRRRQPIDALAAVQRALAAGDGPSAHPGHWSAFALTGPGTWSFERGRQPTDPAAASVEME